jgi:hypothetical protein
MMSPSRSRINARATIPMIFAMGVPIVDCCCESFSGVNPFFLELASFQYGKPQAGPNAQVLKGAAAVSIFRMSC